MSGTNTKWVEARISVLTEKQRALVAATTAALLRVQAPVSKVQVLTPKPQPPSK